MEVGCDNCSLKFANQSKVRKIPATWNSSLGSNKMIAIKLALEEIYKEDKTERPSKSSKGELTYCPSCADILTLLYAFSGFLKTCEFQIPVSIMLENLNSFLHPSNGKKTAETTTTKSTQTDQVDNPYIKLRDCLSTLHPKRKKGDSNVAKSVPETQVENLRHMPFVFANGKTSLTVENPTHPIADRLAPSSKSTSHPILTQGPLVVDRNELEMKNSRSCQICRLQFHSIRYKNIHILNVHRDYDPEKRAELNSFYPSSYCSICDYWLSEPPTQKWGLNYHNEHIHPQLTTPIEGNPKLPAIHSVTHTEIYRFDKCKQAFKYTEIFQNHTTQCKTAIPNAEAKASSASCSSMGFNENGNEMILLPPAPLLTMTEPEEAEAMEDPLAFSEETDKCENNIQFQEDQYQLKMVEIEENNDNESEHGDFVNHESIKVKVRKNKSSNQGRSNPPPIPKVIKSFPRSKQCPVCKIVFNGAKVQEVHILNIHRDYPSEERSVYATAHSDSYCSTCDEWFPRPGLKWGLLGHNAKYHNTELNCNKPRELGAIVRHCLKCFGSFRNSVTLNIHLTHCQGTHGSDNSVEIRNDDMPWDQVDEEMINLSEEIETKPFVLNLPPFTNL